MQQKMIQFSGDVSLPAVGQGTWYMGEDASQRKTEFAALRAGIELGLTPVSYTHLDVYKRQALRKNKATTTIR